MEAVFTRYHHGYKADGNRKLKFVKPAAGPWQQLPQAFEWNDMQLTEVSSAHDLIEGAQIASIGVKSMHDVNLLQNHKRPTTFDHNFDRGSFIKLELPPAFVSRTFGTLHIFGAVNLGKTEWALAQFENPLLVTQRGATSWPTFARAGTMASSSTRSCHGRASHCMSAKPSQTTCNRRQSMSNSRLRPYQSERP